MAEPEDGSALYFGVDVARFGGDRSALAVWSGNTLASITTRQGMDVMQVASWIASEINRHQPKTVRIDEIGIGAGVVDRLKQLGHRNIEAVSVSRAAKKPELHVNLRAELFWRLREALEKGEVTLPLDENLLAELSAIRYDFSPSGQIRLEKKEETKKRVGRSPDLADAVALGFPGGMAEPWFPMIARAGLSPPEKQDRVLAGPHLGPAFDSSGELIR
jgi:phage FluMu gp28-like protein